MIWLAAGIYIGIKYCSMVDSLDEARESVRERMRSIGSISSSLHGSGHGDPSPDRKAIELARRKSNKALFGLESPVRPNDKLLEDNELPGRRPGVTQYEAIEMAPSMHIERFEGNSNGNSIFGDLEDEYSLLFQSESRLTKP